MPRQIRKFFRLLSYGIIFFLVWLLWPRALDSIQDISQRSFSVPDYQMQSLRYVSVRQGEREIELLAQHGAFLLEIQELRLRAVLAHIYGEDKSVTNVTADRGSYQMQTRDLTLQDKIVAEAADGFRLNTDLATYSVGTKMMRIPQGVRGEAADGSIRVSGDRAEAPLTSRTLRIYGNATGSFLEKKHGLTTVRADQAELKRGEESVSFQSNVHVNQGKVELESNKATLNYAKDKKLAVRYLLAQDDVSIKEQSGRFTRSQVAEFFAPNDTIVLTGFPSVYDGDDAVTGDKITLYRSTGVVEATAANAAVGGPRLRPDRTRDNDDDSELAP